MPPPSSALFVIDHGPPAALAPGETRIVLVHGSLDRGASFARVVRRLGDIGVVSYDRRGYHRSRDAGPLATSLEDHVSDLLAIVGDGPAVVVGHSYGGDVALGAAIASPATVRAVGAYEPPLSWEPWWPRRARRNDVEVTPAQFAESFFRRVAGSEAWDRISDQRRAELQADGHALMAELAAIPRDTAPFDLASLAVPAVFGRGENSLWHHRKAVEVLGDTVAGSQVVEFEGARHGAHLTHPDAFALFVRTIFDKAGASAGPASHD